jgi:hypothetical protein
MTLRLKLRLSPCALLAFAAMLIAASLLVAAARPDDPPGEIIGAIEGPAIAVSGPMSVQVVDGQVQTLLRSGSDVRVKSGSARIDLVEGGQISICGPAHLSVLKSGGALTVALDTGIIHARIEGDLALTVYTPQIQAKPIAIGDGPQDTLVGLDAAGAMCIRANRGAVRIEQQLTGQSVIVPQGGDVLLNNGQLDGLRTSASRCSCELQIVKAVPPAPEVSLLASAGDARGKSAESKKAPAPSPTARKPETPEVPEVKEEPIYQVFMPPLRFDASARVQPEPDPNMIILVRRVRVRPTLIFQGRVEGEALVAQNIAPTPNPAAAQQNKPATPAKNPNDSMVDRVRTFFRSLWSRSS